jgi:hypothetical protein
MQAAREEAEARLPPMRSTNVAHEPRTTSYAALELFDRHLRRIGFSELVRAALAVLKWPPCAALP